MSLLLNPIFALLVLATCLLADDTSLLHSPTVHHASAHGVEKATKQVEGQPAVESKASEAPTEAQLSKLEREMVKVEAKFTEYKKSAKAERADLEKLMVEDEKHSLELDAVVDAGLRQLIEMCNSWYASPDVSDEVRKLHLGIVTKANSRRSVFFSCVVECRPAATNSSI
jgi:hypothetical protein